MAQVTSFGISTITGADDTTGLTADSMNVDPVTGVPYYDEAVAAQQAAVAAQMAAANPSGPDMGTILFWGAGLGLLWWGWEKGWFDKWVKKLA